MKYIFSALLILFVYCCNVHAQTQQQAQTALQAADSSLSGAESSLSTSKSSTSSEKTRNSSLWTRYIAARDSGLFTADQLNPIRDSLNSATNELVGTLGADYYNSQADQILNTDTYSATYDDTRAHTEYSNSNWGNCISWSSACQSQCGTANYYIGNAIQMTSAAWSDDNNAENDLQDLGY